MTTTNAMDGVSVLLFDLMGTVTDWHTSTTTAIARHLDPLPGLDAAQLAHAWRDGFFRTAHAMAADGATGALDDIDAVHARVLDGLLEEMGGAAEAVSAETRGALVHEWHRQNVWPDSVEGLARLKKKYIVAVLANGTTRFQIDVTKHARLQFDTLFSSQLIGSVKPRPEMYTTAMDLLGVKPENCAMVAAHFYDLQAAAACGIKTVYIHRSTEDVGLDREEIRKAVNMFVAEDGLSRLAGLLLL